MVVLHAKYGKDVRECGDEGCIGAGWHRPHDDCVGVVYLRNKNVLHIPEGPDRQGAGEISIHGASGGIGKGSIADHIVNHAGFLRGQHVVNLFVCGNDARLGVTRGSCVRAMLMHVALVHSSRVREMGAY